MVMDTHLIFLRSFVHEGNVSFIVSTSGYSPILINIDLAIYRLEEAFLFIKDQLVLLKFE